MKGICKPRPFKPYDCSVCRCFLLRILIISTQRDYLMRAHGVRECSKNYCCFHFSFPMVCSFLGATSHNSLIPLALPFLHLRAWSGCLVCCLEITYLASVGPKPCKPYRQLLREQMYKFPKAVPARTPPIAAGSWPSGALAFLSSQLGDFWYDLYRCTYAE